VERWFGDAAQVAVSSHVPGTPSISHPPSAAPASTIALDATPERLDASELLDALVSDIPDEELRSRDAPASDAPPELAPPLERADELLVWPVVAVELPPAASSPEQRTARRTYASAAARLGITRWSIPLRIRRQLASIVRVMPPLLAEHPPAAIIMTQAHVAFAPVHDDGSG
jgi:hypothetical protein